MTENRRVMIFTRVEKTRPFFLYKYMVIPLLIIKAKVLRVIKAVKYTFNRVDIC